MMKKMLALLLLMSVSVRAEEAVCFEFDHEGQRVENTFDQFKRRCKRKCLCCLTVTGTANIANAVIGTLEVTNNETVGGNLTVEGNIILDGTTLTVEGLDALLAQLTWGEFYETRTVVAPAAITQNNPIPFPSDGPASDINPVERNGVSTTQFVLPADGNYEVTWVVTGVEAAELALALDGTRVPNTAVGSAAATNQIVGNAVITATAGQLLTVIVVSAAGITLAGPVGGSTDISSLLTIKRLS